MRLTTKMRYGTRAMLDLALNYERGPISLRDVADRQEVSLKYMESVLSALQNAGLVRAVRGARGGYALSRPPAEINLRQIYEVLEGSEGFVPCTGDPSICARADACVTQEVWGEMWRACMSVLESTTLEDLAQQTRQRQKRPIMYYV